MKAAILDQYDKNGRALTVRDIPVPEMCAVKQFVFTMAGSKFDKMAAAKGQKYYFIFVHEDGEGLRRVSEIFAEKKIAAAVDGVFSLDEVNKALQKVAAGGSKGKTIIKI